MFDIRWFMDGFGAQAQRFLRAEPYIYGLNITWNKNNTLENWHNVGAAKAAPTIT